MKKAWIYIAVTAVVVAFVVGFWAGRSFHGEAVSIQLRSVNTESKPNDRKLNINTAEARELEYLPGIGPVLGRRIVEYREALGGFTCTCQLLDVEGISEKMYNEFKDMICVGGSYENSGR